MKKFASLLFVAILGGGITLGAYKLIDDDHNADPYPIATDQKDSNFLPVSYSGPPVSSTNADFTEAAERSVHAVVHVKNVQLARVRPRTMREYIQGGGEIRPSLRGTGSGVIVSPDGYIVTNNHVINGANEIEVSLNDNRTYSAEVIGTDPNADIALIKIDADDDLPYLPFGDSDTVRVGEWALAVGNPFNLTSTVTAGIISAKARDINEFDKNPQAFIQTDAAINPGNSGGALVNINGELIGINTAITSQTGSYVGYSFAVPSNVAKKIVSDFIEYGDVQKGVLGVIGISLNPTIAQKLEVNEVEGVYVEGLEPDGGADKAGIDEGDVIKEIDGIRVKGFSDLTGYLNSKSPNDIVNVKVIRDGYEKQVSVKLIKLETLNLADLGFEIRNATSSDLSNINLENGVVINKVKNKEIERYRPFILTAIDDKEVKDIKDVERIMSKKSKGDPISITFINEAGEVNRLIKQ